KRLFTDKRTVFFMVVLPLIMLPVMYTVMGKISQSRSNEIRSYHGTVFIAPEMQKESPIYQEFVDIINEQMNVTINEIPEAYIPTAKELITEKEAQLLITFPDNMDVAYEGIKPFDVHIYYNAASDYSGYFYRRTHDAIKTLSDTLITLRLKSLDIPTEILTPVTANQTISPEQVNLAKKGSEVGKVFGTLLPFIIILYLFVSSMQVGIDTVSGEKERGTLAILLVNQVERASIIIGKLGAVVFAAFASAISSVIGLMIAGRFFLKDLFRSSADMSDFILDANQIIQLIVLLIPVAILLVSLVLICATYARNSKEAAGLVMPLYMVVLILSIGTSSMGETVPAWMHFAPIINTVVSMKSIFIKSSTWGFVLIAAVSSLIFSGILIYFMIKMFKSEKILFRI
ncbi:MAG: ABC transporter permease, partial [Candidatus Cloacimonetes bacterium]|nr:ABC transporter permease [Candidatus Cloacimonadota bacterium]